MLQDPASPKVWNIKFEAANTDSVPVFCSDLGARVGGGGCGGEEEKELGCAELLLIQYKNNKTIVIPTSQSM